MTFLKKYVVTGIALSATLLLGACGGSSGDSAAVPNGTIVSNDFSFPVVSDVEQGGSIEQPTGAAPEFSARRTLSKGLC